MKKSTKDKAKGEAEELKGKVKSKAGEVLHDEDMEIEGKGEELRGKARKKLGDIEDVFEE